MRDDDIATILDSLGRAFIFSAVCSEEATSCSIQLLLFKCVLCACVHICCQNVGDKLKKEHKECFPCKDFSIFPLCVYMCLWRLGRGEGGG